MIKIIDQEKRECVCACCNSKLSYENEDVKKRLFTAGACFYGGTEETYVYYITCPVCGEEIALRFHKNYK